MAYTPRLNPPATSDRRWIKTTYGGYNQCILINSTTGAVIPNCTGYVHGRAMEIARATTDNLGLSFGDGVDYWTGSSSDWVRSQTPSLGAILCFGQGSMTAHPGHVCVVERIIDLDTIVTSDSNYGAEYFVLRTRYRRLHWNFYEGSPLVFQGFLKNPYVDGGGGGGTGKKLPRLAHMLKIRKRNLGKEITTL